MGDEVSRTEYTEEDFERHDAQVSAELAELERLLSEAHFDMSHPRAGMELELNLVDQEGRPALAAAPVLKAINDPLFVAELGRFNVELNLSPRELGPTGLRTFAETLRSSLSDAGRRARGHDARLVAIGTLPTLTADLLHAGALTESPRFEALDQQMGRLRGGPVVIEMDAGEGVRMEFDSIAPEAACTSFQIHLQVAPAQFAPYWNASQAIAGIQLALGANSPWFCGRHAYAESRIPIFTQSADSRTPAERRENARPRVWFGERWIESVLDLMRENAEFAPLLPDLPEAKDEEGAPALRAMSLHNGTVYRWNRPVYDVAGGQPHLRIENRVLPAGPSVVDMVANTALYAGLTRALAQQEHPVWLEEPFSVAEQNFLAGQRDGIEAEVEWPGLGRLRATTLVLEHLLPLAAAGLQVYDVDSAEISEHLGVIEARARRGINGATWQVRAVEAREKAGESREQALRGMLADYMTQQAENKPVHEWEW